MARQTQAKDRDAEGWSAIGPDAIALLGGSALILYLSFGTWICASIGAAVQGLPKPPGPMATLFHVIKGDYQLAAISIILMVVLFLVTVTGLTLFIMRSKKKKASKVKVDGAAKFTAPPKEISKLNRINSQAKADKLGCGASGPGVFVGKAVVNGVPIYSDWEAMQIDIWGPRTGKTTSRAIPSIIDAPGAVIATSNKRDIVDGTRLDREKKGKVWVFDPMGVCGEEPSWYWNPLTYITNEEKARLMASNIIKSQESENNRTDDFFAGQGATLLTGCLLAATVARRPITQVYDWLSDPRDDEPARILMATPGLERSARAVQSIVTSPDKQRGGVYSTAQQNVVFLVSQDLQKWLAPQGPNDRRPQFSPYQFVRDGNATLYCLSKEGPASAGPMVAALTIATVEAAEDFGTTQPMGRLKTPMLGVLDEAANVCRWKDLPDQYSHFGSRGIILMTILQSWAQGVECWGERGMEKLWSSANMRVYGGGVSDTQFLKRISDLMGQKAAHMRTTSWGDGKRSTSNQIIYQDIIDVAGLGSMPPGRAIVLPSGIPPILTEMVPWYKREDAKRVADSFKKYEANTAGSYSDNPWARSGKPQQQAAPVPTWEKRRG